jgi:hypothetical protein
VSDTAGQRVWEQLPAAAGEGPDAPATESES